MLRIFTKSPTEQLKNAIKNNSYSKAVKAIQNGVDMKEINKSMSPLIKPIYKSNYELFELLLKNGASINKNVDKNDDSPLLADYRLLADYPLLASLEKLSSKKKSDQDYKIFNLLIAHPYFNDHAHPERTVLAFIMKYNAFLREEGIKKLLFSHPGFDINLNLMVLVTQVLVAKNEVNEYLLGHVLQDISIYSNIDFNQLLNNIINDHPELGNSFLIYAVEENKLELVSYLLTRPEIDIHKKEQYSFDAPLCIAVNNGHVDMARLLINAGANVNVSSPHGTLLEAATYHYDPKMNYVKYNSEQYHTIMMLLLEHRPNNINHLNNDHETVLFRVVRLGELAVCKKLIECGADVDIVNKKGETLTRVANDKIINELYQLIKDKKNSLTTSLSLATSAFSQFATQTTTSSIDLPESSQQIKQKL